MAQIFLGTDPRSLAVDIMAKYTRAVDADLVKVTQVTPEQQKVLNIDSVPCMVVTEGDKTFKVAAPYAIFRHIAQLTRFESIFLGRNEMENNQVLSYFEIISNLSAEDLTELLNKDLQLRMFLVTYNITAADIFAYAHLVNHIQELQDFEKVAQNNVFRWIDHIQHLPGIDKYASTNSLVVSFPDENAKQPSKRELKKMAKKQYQQENKGDKKDKKQQKQQKPKEDKKVEKEDNKEDNKEEEKKELDTSVSTNASKKDKKKQKQQNQPKAKGQPADDGEPITKLDIRVGQITKVWKHPDSDKLYCEEVDVGEEKPRSIASGLQQYVPIEKMENAMVIVLANLKARKLAGFSSHGMVMCAETPDKSAVELLTPPEGSKPGDLITVKGFDRNPPATMNPKKKFFESVVGDFKIDESGVAKFKDAEWTTDKGIIVAENIRNGIIA